MLTNANCTVYNSRVDRTTRMDVWAKFYVYGVFWDSSAHTKQGDKGDVRSSACQILVPESSAAAYQSPKAYASDPSGAYTFCPGAIIVRGIILEDIGTDFTVVDLQRKYDDVYTITAVKDCRYGSPGMRHFELECE